MCFIVFEGHCTSTIFLNLAMTIQQPYLCVSDNMLENCEGFNFTVLKVAAVSRHRLYEVKKEICQKHDDGKISSKCMKIIG